MVASTFRVALWRLDDRNTASRLPSHRMRKSRPNGIEAICGHPEGASESGRGGSAFQALQPHPETCVFLVKGERVSQPSQETSGTEETVQLNSRIKRRKTLQRMVFSSLAALDPLGWLRPNDSKAALLQFPATDLRNTYYLIRAGEGESEAENFVLTNPVAKTSMTSGLSLLGRRQVVRETIPALQALGACSEGCWIWPSICQRSYQTAEILSSVLGISRSRITPEYSFLDARGLGDLEGLTLEAAARQVAEGDSVSSEWRPPKGTDGTPNESVQDVFVRVRQVMSITETQYRNSDILIVSPDSDNLSILQAALLGFDLRQHRSFAFQPGEARVLQLSEEPGEYKTTTFSCPNPPRCRP